LDATAIYVVYHGDAEMLQLLQLLELERRDSSIRLCNNVGKGFHKVILTKVVSSTCSYFPCPIYLTINICINISKG